jgi:hypothetical protein
MASQKRLNDADIAKMLLLAEDDDDLGSISVDDDDGDNEGPEEYEEVFTDQQPEQQPILTPPPPSPPSPGSQDMFLPASPETQDILDEQLPSPTAVPIREPPAKRRRVEPQQKPNSGNGALNATASSNWYRTGIWFCFRIRIIKTLYLAVNSQNF